MKKKLLLCEIVQKGKVLETIPCRHFLKIQGFVAQVDKKKGPVSLRCPHCHGPLAWIAEPFILDYTLLRGVQICPVCFPEKEAAQHDAILEKVEFNRPLGGYQ